MDRFVVKKPWGNFEQFCVNEKCSVKIMTIDPDSELSLQYHKNRDEFCKIISGEGKITIGEQTKDAKLGYEFLIKRGTKHRVRAEKSQVKVLEISFGEFDEDDEIRLEDKYGRV